MFLDLHSHSTCSDGTLTPSELIFLAKKEKLELYSLTDHDNINGQEEAIKLSKLEGLNYIPGVEISCEFPTMLDMLGYNFDINNQELNKTLDELQFIRKNRNILMIERLKTLGFDISFEEVQNEAGSDVIGRPHFARVLVNKGYVANKDQAFDKYLGDNKPGYVSKKRLTPEEAIQLIRNAGGVPVLAHPTYLKLSSEKLDSLLKKLKNFGLWGIEAYYSKHHPHERRLFLEMAKKYDLFVTSGSDYHGDNSPDVKSLGMKVEDDILIRTKNYFLNRGV